MKAPPNAPNVPIVDGGLRGGEYADAEIGRLVDTIKDRGQLDNTLIFYVIGDNGASAEGGMNVLFNEATYFNRVEEKTDDIIKHIDELGGPDTYNHYAAGWAVGGDTPLPGQSRSLQLWRRPQPKIHHKSANSRTFERMTKSGKAPDFSGR